VVAEAVTKYVHIEFGPDWQLEQKAATTVTFQTDDGRAPRNSALVHYLYIVVFPIQVATGRSLTWQAIPRRMMRLRVKPTGFRRLDAAWGY
jgi:hypothetical protein